MAGTVAIVVATFAAVGAIVVAAVNGIGVLKAKSGVFILVGVLRFSVIVLPSLFGARGLLLW